MTYSKVFIREDKVWIVVHKSGYNELWYGINGENLSKISSASFHLLDIPNEVAHYLKNEIDE